MPFSIPDLDDQAVQCLLEALTASGQAIAVYDAEDRLQYANGTYQSIFLAGQGGEITFADALRRGAQYCIGTKIDDGDAEALIARTYARRRSRPHRSFETDLVDGRWFWMEETTLPNGWVLTVGADITALKHNEKTLRQAHEEALIASRTDLLTGLPNRRHVPERLDEVLAASRLTGGSLCVAVIDLDHFKAINDTHGHDAGDAVLQHFAGIFRERVREQDVLGRTGGEEFVLVLPGVRPGDAISIINRIRDDFPPAKLPEMRIELFYTFSAGIARALPDDDRGLLLRRADRALYAAKRDGRNCTKTETEEKEGEHLVEANASAPMR